MEKQVKEEPIPLTESCRLCLRKQGVFNVFKIKGLLLDIYDIIGVRVFISGNLPQKICKDCSALLNDVKYLRQVASDNDERMRSLASNAIRKSNQNLVNGQMFQEDQIENSANISSVDNVGGTYIKTEKIEDPVYFGSEEDPGISQLSREGQTNGVKSEDNTSSDGNFCIKTEHVENPPGSGSDEEAGMTQDTIRNDLFTSSDIEKYLETQISTHWPQLNDTRIRQKPLQPQSSYRCEACAKDFPTWKKFYFHNRFHNKSIPCPLEDCFKKFASKADLEKHFRTHTGEKPYQCEVCPRRFAQRGTLKYHRESVHKKITEVIIGT